jgi:hypothetical protein
MIVDRNLGEDIMIPACEIISLDIKHQGQDQYGSVSSGVLLIKGACIRLRCCEAGATVLRSIEDRQHNAHPRSPRTSHKYWMKDGFNDLWLDCTKELSQNSAAVMSELIDQDVILVEIASFGFRKQPEEGQKKSCNMNDAELRASIIHYPERRWGLVFMPTRDSKAQYRRVGVARMSRNMNTGWETRLITII